MIRGDRDSRGDSVGSRMGSLCCFPLCKVEYDLFCRATVGIENIKIKMKNRTVSGTVTLKSFKRMVLHIKKWS